jgi:DinB family protein
MHDPDSVLRAARRALADLPPVLDAMLADLGEATARTRPAADEWAPIEILCHLRDEETEDFGARLRAVLDGHGEFAPIDPEGWVEARRYREAGLGEVLADLCRRRGASLAFLASVQPERLSNALPHRSLGQLSGLDLVVAWAAHDRLHVAQLAAALARLWATRWAPLKAEYAGPIPYAPGVKGG